ncbi:MAG: DJ-1 family glyoxalase III [Planctomycetota bacterium]
MGKRVVVPLAEGVEEMEAVIIIDVLRRAGLDVVAAGLDGVGPVLASRGVTLYADEGLDEALALRAAALVLPGGMGGMERLRGDERILASVRAFLAEGRLVAAVCAAPLVLARAGEAAGRRMTCHPSVREELLEAGAEAAEGRVVQDGTVLTSLGPGSSMEFALAVAAELVGPERALEVSSAMCV